MKPALSGAREASSSFARRLVARAAAQDLGAFVVPGPEVARARGLDLDLEAAGLRVVATPRHASVLLVVGDPPEGLGRATSVAYAQMPRPRAVFVVGAQDAPPLPRPDITVDLDQGSLASGVAEMRRLFAEGAFDPEAESFEAAVLCGRTEYVCSMHPEVVRNEPGTCPKCGMDLVPREAGEGDHRGSADHGHEGHGHAQHEGVDRAGNEEGERGRSEHAVSAGNDGAGPGGREGMNHGGHGHMDHGDMGFMSMVDMTQGTPRSSDGLQMEWVEAPFGPLFPGLPGGFSLTLTLDGDTVARAAADSAVSRRVDSLEGPLERFPDRLAMLDPLSPVAYWLLILRAIENALGAEVDERIALARVGALERERAASHLGWLASFGYLLGHGWLSRRAGQLQLALLRTEDAEEIGRVQSEVRGFLRRVEWTPLLKRKLAGVGSLHPSELAGAAGPVVRAGGIQSDVRADEEIYRSVDFEPIVLEGGDALSRFRVRLAELEQSLELVRVAGSISAPEKPLGGTPSGAGRAAVETPRGTATLTVTLEAGAVSVAELDTPSARHIGLVEAVTGQWEVADALVGVASLDLSPWSVAGRAAQ